MKKILVIVMFLVSGFVFGLNIGGPIEFNPIATMDTYSGYSSMYLGTQFSLQNLIEYPEISILFTELGISPIYGISGLIGVNTVLGQLYLGATKSLVKGDISPETGVRVHYGVLLAGVSLHKRENFVGCFSLGLIF